MAASPNCGHNQHGLMGEKALGPMFSWPCCLAPVARRTWPHVYYIICHEIQDSLLLSHVAVACDHLICVLALSISRGKRT